MAQFHQRMRQSLGMRHSLSSLLCGPAAAAVALVASSSVSRLEAEPEATANAAASTPPPGVEFVGVFVEKESAKKLRAQYPSKFGGVVSDDANGEQLFLVLKYNPTDKEKEAFAPIMGRTAQLHVKGYVEDELAQAVLVHVTTESGDPIDFESGGEFPHVTLASVNGAQGLNSGYTSVLLERLRASRKLQWLLDQEAAADVETAWTGELPAFESKHLALFNPFPAVTAAVNPIKASEEEQDERDVLQGTVCVSSSFDPVTGQCTGAQTKPECGFCKFMKAGPCGKEFSAWEACLDRSKQKGLDFIEHCGAETLALRDCVDANPEYYHVLNESSEADEEADAVDAPVDAEQAQ